MAGAMLFTSVVANGNPVMDALGLKLVLGDIQTPELLSVSGKRELLAAEFTTPADKGSSLTDA